MNQDVKEVLDGIAYSYEQCGSTVTCNPAPSETDIDYLVELPDDDKKVSDFVDKMILLGFTWEGAGHYQDAASTFMSWRSEDGKVNLIVTRSSDFANRHRAATSVCKRLNLLDKEDRIALFQAVLYGNADA
jgi:hypothetical protein